MTTVNGRPSCKTDLPICEQRCREWPLRVNSVVDDRDKAAGRVRTAPESGHRNFLYSARCSEVPRARMISGRRFVESRRATMVTAGPFTRGATLERPSTLADRPTVLFSLRPAELV